MIGGFFKSRKPKQFNFSARYYDADREDFEKRVRSAKWEAENPELAGTFSDKWRQKSRLEEKQRSNRRIMIIAGLLFLVVYIYLKYA